MTCLFSGPGYMPALIAFLAMAIALISFGIGVAVTTRVTNWHLKRVESSTGISVTNAGITVVDAKKLVAIPEVDKAIIDLIRNAARIPTVTAMDSKSIMDNSTAIAHAIAKEIRSGSPAGDDITRAFLGRRL